MSIRRGHDWGTHAALPAEAPVVADDLSLRRLFEEGRRSGAGPPTVGLLGGDLCRTLGGTGDAGRLRSTDAMTFPVDAVHVVLDHEREHWFVAHLVARRPLWWGWACAAMNAQYLGDWDLGPRAHPGDGLVDVTSGSLPLGDRVQARSRVRSGAHLPHPALATRRTGRTTIELPTGLVVRLDGEPVGRARHLELDVEPDALLVVV